MQRLRTRLIPVLMLGFLLAGCREQAQESSAPAPPPPPVTVANPIAKQITEWDEFTGRFVPVETVEVRARVSGLVSTTYFREGQMVKRGDLLFVIDREPFEIAVARATAEVRQAEARLALAINEVKRAEPLVARNTIPQSEFDSRLSRQREAEGQLQQTKAALRATELDLKWTEVRAPISGRISDTRVDPGNLISGGQPNSTLLTTIVSLDPIHFEFEASEADYLKYTRLASSGRRISSRDAQNPVAVRLSDEGDFVHKGKMDFVDNVLDPNSGTIRGRAVFENGSLLLLPGVFGRLRLFGGESDALLIPDSAIASDLASRIVMVVADDGTVSQKVVTLGPIIDGLRVVRSGLSADDRIIIAGLQRARPGQKVTPEPGKIEPKAKPSR